MHDCWIADLDLPAAVGAPAWTCHHLDVGKVEPCRSRFAGWSSGAAGSEPGPRHSGWTRWSEFPHEVLDIAEAVISSSSEHHFASARRDSVLDHVGITTPRAVHCTAGCLRRHSVEHEE